jgi:hypothetical protein
LAPLDKAVASVFHDGAQQHGRDDPRPRGLTSFEPGMVAMRLGIGVAIHPVAVISPQLSQIIIPVGPHAQGITDEGSHHGTGRTIFDRDSVHLF